jgi:hypothetical protein
MLITRVTETLALNWLCRDIHIWSRQSSLKYNQWLYMANVQQQRCLSKPFNNQWTGLAHATWTRKHQYWVGDLHSQLCRKAPTHCRDSSLDVEWCRWDEGDEAGGWGGEGVREEVNKKKTNSIGWAWPSTPYLDQRELSLTLHPLSWPERVEPDPPPLILTRESWAWPSTPTTQSANFKIKTLAFPWKVHK